MDALLRSFAPVVRQDTRLLICGSLPGARSLAAQRYYAHPQNHFWRLVGAAIGRELAALPYPDRLAALLDARIGLWDVVASGARQGSLDGAIRIAETHDLRALLRDHPAIAAVAFNGGKAAAVGTRILGNLPIATLALPSSSPAYTIGFERKLAAWRRIADHLPVEGSGAGD